MIGALKRKWFSIKCYFLGKYFWVGPEIEGGVCDACANELHFEKQSVRRLISEDNIYLCKAHWNF